MKIQIKFDQKAIAAFFLEHFEKMLFAGVLLGLGMFAYWAIVQKVYDKKPEDLQQNTKTARDKVESTRPDVPPPPDFRPESATIAKDEYRWATLLDPPIFPMRLKRSTPKFYPAQDLIATADAGPILYEQKPVRGAAPAAAPAAASGAAVHGYRWVVVTGLVPWADQVSAYRAAFKDNPQPDHDTPVYAPAPGVTTANGLTVERAEVSGSGGGALNWKPIDLDEIQKITAKFPRHGSSREIAPPHVIHEALTAPLPPVQDRAPEPRAVLHPPQIMPVAAPTGPAGATGPVAPRPAEPAATPGPANHAYDPFGANRATTPDAAPRPAVEGEPNAAHPAEPEVVEKYLLLRFFDFTVVSGKQYRYRVRLTLANPNYKLESTVLNNDAKTSKDTLWLQTDWSEPSDVVSVPNDDRFCLVSVQPPARVGQEPSAALMVFKWLQDSGEEVHQSIAGVLRGKTTFFKEKAKAGSVSREITFKTDCVLLDMRGGERLSQRDAGNEPAEILLLSADGTLIVHSDLDDLAEVDAAAQVVHAVVEHPPTPAGPTVDIFHRDTAPKPVPKPRKPKTSR